VNVRVCAYVRACVQNDDHGDLSAVTQTQLNGLNNELQSLASTKQNIVNSLTVQRQQTAAKMASDAMYADHVRLNRATATTSSRQMRSAMRAAQMAEQRAREASVIQANQDAIARLQMQRVATFQGQNQMALAAAANSESQLRAAEAYKRSNTDRRYHQAMSGYTSSLQGSVADDMLTLNRLKVAEEAAAPGPHVISSVWEQPPTGSTLPDVDPNLFMNDAPLRDIDSLTSAEYTQTAGTTELGQKGGAKTQKLAAVAKPMLPRRAGRALAAKQHKSPFIMRVMEQADAELKSLKSSKARMTQLSPVQASKSARLHSTVDATLQQLEQQARTEGIDVNPVDKDFKAPPAAALARSPTLSAGDNDSAFAAMSSDAGEEAPKLSTQHFTSFALNSKGAVRTSIRSERYLFPKHARAQT
jgi:hypothetical protein